MAQRKIIVRFTYLTQAEYDALAVKSPTTLYLIKG